MPKEGGAMPTTKEPDFDYQTYMRQHAPPSEHIQHGTAGREERRELAKHKITIRIDADIIEQFKHMVPAGQGYQRLMNQALREWLMAQGVKELVREELQALTAQMKASLQEVSRRS
jgi:uncharacterized protein (DUF4415 family)